MRRLYYNAKMSSKSVFVAWLVVFVFSFLLFTWVKKNVLVELQVQNVTVLSPPESEAGDEDEAEPEFVNIYELNMTRVGEWVPGYRHVEDCQVKMRDPQSTCCSLKGRKLHFEFYDDNLKNNDSVLEEVLQKVKGKNVTIFGDSLQRNFFMGVAEVFKLGKYHVHLISPVLIIISSFVNHNVSIKKNKNVCFTFISIFVDFLGNHLSNQENEMCILFLTGFSGEKFGNVPLNDGEEYQVKWYSVLGEQEPPFNLHLLQYYTYEAEPCSPAVQHFKLSKKMLLEGLNKSEIIILNSGEQFALLETCTVVPG